eukprot:m.121179 g.121179  ORF g.121179 m.121179 type:complete len:350 (-) comp16196_c0_seq1:254-1303(-)
MCDQIVQEMPAVEDVMDADESLPCVAIDELQGTAVNVADINKLKEFGLHTVESVIQCPRRRLLTIKGFSDAKVDKIKASAAKLVPLQFETANRVLEKRQAVFHIPTGSKELDALLEGGIESQAITEIHGEYRTGKTQMAHTLCITAQLPSQDSLSRKYTGGKVFFVDGEGTFRPERLRPICARFGLEESRAMDNIYVYRAYNSEQLTDAMIAAQSVMAEEPGVFKLLIIDSIMALYRVDYTGRGELADRQQSLNQLLSRIQRMAEEWKIAVYVTNQVTADPGGGMASFVVDPKKPIGGHVMAHGVQTRIQVRRSRGEERIAKVIDSPTIAENEARFALTDGGVSDSAQT